MPKLVRIDDDLHERIFKVAESKNRTAGEIIEYSFSRVFNGDSAIPELLAKKRKKTYVTPPYGIPVALMTQLPARVPEGRKPELEDPAAASLYEYVRDYDETGHMVLCTHNMTGTIAFLSGCPKGSPRVLRFGICPALMEVKYPFKLAVSEESLDVYIPANASAQHVMHIIGYGARDCFEKEYYTAIELALLWHAGFIIEYVEGI
jgi:hypothetical protein